MRLASGKVIEKQAYLNTNVVDAIGAGDSFNSGFIHKFMLGESMEDCLDYGSLTGAVSTTASGGTGAFEDMELVRKKIKEFKEK